MTWADRTDRILRALLFVSVPTLWWAYFHYATPEPLVIRETYYAAVKLGPRTELVRAENGAFRDCVVRVE